MSKESYPLQMQVAALPWRRTDEGGLEVMLLTSRETRRLIVPKGWIAKGLPPPASAAKEAFEEAGLHGVVATAPCASFRYMKRLDDGFVVPVRVEVFAFAVVGQSEDWPEKGQRMLHWFPPSLAAELADDEGLADILRRVASGELRLG